MAHTVSYQLNDIIFTIFPAFTYPIISHWTWDPHGWLAFAGWHKSGGMQDFAGSAVVHMGGGVCAFVGTFILGPRTRV